MPVDKLSKLPPCQPVEYVVYYPHGKGRGEEGCHRGLPHSRPAHAYRMAARDDSCFPLILRPKGAR